MQSYTITSVSKITKIPVATLRNWERRYSFLAPNRREDGIRLYSEEDVGLLREIARLLDSGSKIGDLAEEIRKGRKLCTLQTPVAQVAPDVELEIAEFRSALLKCDMRRVQHLLSLLSLRLGVVKLIDQVFEPMVQALLGSDEETRKVDPAVRAYALSFIRKKLMAYLGTDVPWNPIQKRMPVLATPEHEHNDFGVLMMGAHLRMKGFQFYYLGSNVPLKSLVQFAREVDAGALVLSVESPSSTQVGWGDLPQAGAPVYLSGKLARQVIETEGLQGEVRMAAGPMEGAAERVIESCA